MNKIAQSMLFARAAALSRRSSLRLAGISALGAALGSPMATTAGKRGSNASSRCKKQRGRCRAYFAELCAETENPLDCQQALIPCCDPLAACKAEEMLDCIFEAFTQ